MAGLVRHLWYWVPLPPPANKRLIPARNSKRWVLSPEYRRYKDEVKILLESQRNGIPIAGPVHIRVAIYPNDFRRDMDSYEKCLFDVLQDFVYSNDNQIKRKDVELHKPDKGNPRIVIEAWPLE